MNRRNFFSRLATVAAAAAIIPSVLADAKPEAVDVEWCGWEELPLNERARYVSKNTFSVVRTNINSATHSEIEMTLHGALRYGDRVEIPSTYTNHDLTTEWFVTGPIGVFLQEEGQMICRLMPLDPNVALIDRIPYGTQLHTT